MDRRTAWRVYKWKPHWRSSVNAAVRLQLFHHDTLHDFDQDKAARALEKVLAKPPFFALGKPFDDDTVERVKTVKQFLKFINAPMYGNVSTEANNYLAFLCRSKFGKEWFNKNWNRNVSTIWNMLDSKKTKPKIERNVASHDPSIDDGVVQTLYGDFVDVALARGYGLHKSQSFALTWIEPWLLRGHAPCGWRGRLPALPKAPVGQSPYEGLDLSGVLGDGVIRVY